MYLFCFFVLFFFFQGKKRDEGSNQEDKVFELLFCHMALQLFTEPEQVVDILQVGFASDPLALIKKKIGKQTDKNNGSSKMSFALVDLKIDSDKK